MTAPSQKKPASTELTGGAGFNYEDIIVAYYVSALLRRERAAFQSGHVVSVSVQRQGHGHPLDDLIVEFDHAGDRRVLDLQVKTSLTISGAPSNADFRSILSAAKATMSISGFDRENDRCGFVVEQVSPEPLRSLNRLIDWARASPDADDFDARFKTTGTAGADETNLRNAIKSILSFADLEEEVGFFRNLIGRRLDEFTDDGLFRSEVVNRLQELVAANLDGQDLPVFDRLCRIARNASAKATKWTRATLLEQLRGTVKLNVTSHLKNDIDRLQIYSLEGLNAIIDKVDDFHVERSGLSAAVEQKLEKHRVVCVTGLPGCGKSALLRDKAMAASTAGPIICLKNDRLAGNGWSGFAVSMGLSSMTPLALLEEISATGTPVLFIDGIDRVRPDQQGVILDILNTIATEPTLANWRILATSRDQGLEVFRSWFPARLYADDGIGDVTVGEFSDDESEQLVRVRSSLRPLLFGKPAVQSIARRPFFASVLSGLVLDGSEPQSEVDLIAAWWERAGYNTASGLIPQRPTRDYRFGRDRCAESWQEHCRPATERRHYGADRRSPR